MRLYGIAILVVTIAACDSESNPPQPQECTPAASLELEPLQWKRVQGWTNDLATALAVDADAACVEFGTNPCVDVHRIALGGSDPFGASLYVPVATPPSTTPLIVDRVVLSACTQRLNLDAEGDPVVFSHIDLDAASLDPQAPEVTAQIETLYRLLLRRDATAEEIATVAELTLGPDGEPVSARMFAQLACFTVGTTSESLFF